MAVNKEGVVGVIWYDGFDHVDTAGYQVRFSASMDGGNNWLPSVLVSESPTVFAGTEKWELGGDVTHSSGSSPIERHLWPFRWTPPGETAGLSPDANGVFHAFWIDNRTGVNQVWTAPIAISGSAANNGAKELRNLEDLSSNVQVEILSIDLDRKEAKLTASVRLKNISEQTFVPPLKMRILSLSSEFGSPHVRTQKTTFQGAAQY